MAQLKLGEILDLVQQLKQSGMSLKQIKDLPIYIGDDEELNGIHNAYFCETMDAENKLELEVFNDLIDNCGTELKGKAILIS